MKQRHQMKDADGGQDDKNKALLNRRGDKAEGENTLQLKCMLPRHRLHSVPRAFHG